MADFIETTAGMGGGDKIAGDEIANGDGILIKHQRVKIEVGADGSATDVSTANPMPIIPGTGATIDTSDVTITNVAGSPVYIAPGTGVNLDTSAVTISAELPAGTQYLGTIGHDNGATYARIIESGAQTYIGGSLIALTRAAINASTSGNNTIVTAVAGQVIYVLGIYLISSGTVTATFQDGAGGTALTGPIPLVANTGFVLPQASGIWFHTSTNTLLNLSLSAAVQVSGGLIYAQG